MHSDSGRSRGVSHLTTSLWDANEFLWGRNVSAMQRLAHGNCNKKIDFFSKNLRKMYFLDKV